MSRKLVLDAVASNTLTERTYFTNLRAHDPFSFMAVVTSPEDTADIGLVDTDSSYLFLKKRRYFKALHPMNESMIVTLGTALAIAVDFMFSERMDVRTFSIIELIWFPTCRFLSCLKKHGLLG